jgi:hypothetical protein
MNEGEEEEYIIYEKGRREGPLGRPRRRWVVNFKMNLEAIGWGGMGCTDLSQDGDHWGALVNKVMNLRGP